MARFTYLLCTYTAITIINKPQMSSFVKEPNIKLIPSDPMTNTILIIYCVSSTGASVPYKSTWRRVHPKKNKAEEIKHHNGSSYRCSPLDIDYVIEATVYFQHQNLQLSRIVMSNVVKVSRELKQKKMLLKEPIIGRTTIHDHALEMRFHIQDNTLIITPNLPSFSHLSLAVPLTDLQVETYGSPLTFKMTFKQKIQDFCNLITPVLGWKPQLKNNEVTWEFVTDLNRDIILLGISEILHKPHKFQHGLHFPVTARNIVDKNGKTTREKDFFDKSPNRSQKSVSPSAAYLDKYKLPNKQTTMKTSFAGAAVPDKKEKEKEKEKETHVSPTTPDIKKDKDKDKEKDNSKQREYLNVFEDEDLQFLNSIPQQSSMMSVSKPKTQNSVEKSGIGDGPSINLRGSFEELEKSFNSNVNDEILEKVFGNDNNGVKKMQEEIDHLKSENEQLKKQVEGIGQLGRENNSIKRKYLEMKEEVSRLEMERKVILTDKLRCEVNWHKEIQEKEALKRELEHYRQSPHPSNAHMDRSMRIPTTYKHSNNDRIFQQMQAKEINRSPNKSFHHC